MIKTIQGSEVEVVSGSIYSDEIDVRRIRDGRILKTFVDQLVADGGVEEINKAIIAVDFSTFWIERKRNTAALAA